ncbi:MAG: amino acid ABC transporter permease [Pseudorhodobacter sp.]
MSDLHAQTVPFVRNTMIEAAPPPASEVGVVGWMRENLLSSWLNILLTVLGLGAVAFVVMEIGPWLLNSVWGVDSLSECREILQGASGACLAVIRDRWHQLIFGFYPSGSYWRPILAFFLMIVAMAPVLFAEVPRKLFWFSAVYPFLAFWLLWGGTIWLPIMTMVGFVVGYVTYRVLAQVSPLAAIILCVLVTILWWLFAADPLSDQLARMLSIRLRAVDSDEFGGFLVSTVIGVTGIAFSLPIGIVLALGRRSDMFLVRAVSIGFIEFIRGVPLITLLFTASLLLNYFLPPGTNFDIILRVIIMVTLFASAYMAEVVRGGLAALPRGQYEAADALGLDYWKAQRLIIMPQALKISIPGIVNTFIGLFKDTTLVVFIGILDPIGLSSAIRADSDWNGIYWELFGFVGLCFFIFCFSMSRYSQYLERKLKTDHH